MNFDNLIQNTFWPGFIGLSRPIGYPNLSVYPDLFYPNLYLL